MLWIDVSMVLGEEPTTLLEASCPCNYTNEKVKQNKKKIFENILS